MFIDSFTFAPGMTEQCSNVTLIDDLVSEPNETFDLITSLTSDIFHTTYVTAVIVDDDG